LAAVDAHYYANEGLTASEKRENQIDRSGHVGAGSTNTSREATDSPKDEGTPGRKESPAFSLPTAPANVEKSSFRAAPG